MIDAFDTPEKAEEIMKLPYYVEYENGDKDEVYPDEMWIEEYEELPFAEPLKPEEANWAAVNADELPF